MWFSTTSGTSFAVWSLWSGCGFNPAAVQSPSPSWHWELTGSRVRLLGRKARCSEMVTLSLAWQGPAVPPHHSAEPYGIPQPQPFPAIQTSPCSGSLNTHFLTLHSTSQACPNKLKGFWANLLPPLLTQTEQLLTATIPMMGFLPAPPGFSNPAKTWGCSQQQEIHSEKAA